MAKSSIILTQILQIIPWLLFEKLVGQYNVDKGVRTMPAASHLAVMLFAQFAGLPSLRRIEEATVALTPSQRRSGLTETPRSTLADANIRIDWMFYRDLFYGLLQQVQRHFPRHHFDLPGKLFSLDSTVIPLCLSLCKWAKFKTRKGGLKLHTLLDHDGYIPNFIRVTPAKVNDVIEGRKFKFNKGDTLLFDKGYFDSDWFYKLCKQGVFFVTRIKDNIGFEWVEQRKCNRKAGIVADWIGYMTGTCGKQCPCMLRLVRFVDPETGNELEFLTNLLDIDANIIADLYRERWQIETFFKWIKQHLKIKTYLSTDQNAVLVQIWIAMIAYLLARLVQQKDAEGAISTHCLMSFIATRILVEIPLCLAWQDFQRTRNKQKTKNVLQPRRLN